MPREPLINSVVSAVSPAAISEASVVRPGRMGADRTRIGCQSGGRLAEVWTDQHAPLGDADGQRRDVAMGRRSGGTELQHIAQHRDARGRAVGKYLERGTHGRGVGVVGVVDHRGPARVAVVQDLAAHRRVTRRGPGGLDALLGDAETAGNGAGGRRVQPVVFARQRQPRGHGVQIEALNRKGGFGGDRQRDRQSVFDRENGRAAVRDVRQHSRFLAGDAGKVPKELQVLLADARDHGDVRTHDRRQGRDLARMVGADLGDQEIMPGARPEQRQRHPEMIVEALWALAAVESGMAQNLMDQVAGRGLAIAAADADDATIGSA